MKQVIPGERYEKRGSGQTWINLLLGFLLLVNAVLRTVRDGWTGMSILFWLGAVLYLTTAFLWARHLLIADEAGIVISHGGNRRRMIRWDDIVRIVNYSDDFRHSDGLYVYTADAPEKAIFLGRDEELMPVIQRYCMQPVEKKY